MRYCSDLAQRWCNCINHKRINREVVAGNSGAGSHTDGAVIVSSFTQGIEGYSIIVFIVFTDSCSVITVATPTVVDRSRQSRKEGVIWCVVIS